MWVRDKLRAKWGGVGRERGGEGGTLFFDEIMLIVSFRG